MIPERRRLAPDRSPASRRGRAGGAIAVAAAAAAALALATVTTSAADAAPPSAGPGGAGTEISRAAAAAAGGSDETAALQQSPAHDGPRLEGAWQGDLSIAGQHLTIVVHLRPAGEDGWTATVDSPDQGAMGIPVDSVVVDSSVVRLHASEIGGRYEARLAEDGDALRGRWMQRGRSIPLVLRPVDEPATPTRPQEPEGELPYRTDSVRLAVPGEGVELAGTLSVPEGEGPFPGVIFLSGSGAQTRDGEVAGHRPFLVLADRMAREGVASLRLDDRGTGASAGDLEETPLDRSAETALAALRWLGGRADVAADRVGLLGHSEGSLVAGLAAARSPEEVGFLVFLAPPAVPADSLMSAQHRAIGGAAGLPDAIVAEQVRVTRRILAIVREEEDRDAALEAIARAVEDAARDVPPGNRRAFRQLMGRSRAAELAYTRMTAPRFRSYLALEPDTVLDRLRAPVLALYGSRDLQVLPAQNVPALAAQLARAPTEDVTVRVLPRLNHLLQSAGSGLPSEYGRLEETIAPRALREIVRWIGER